MTLSRIFILLLLTALSIPGLAQIVTVSLPHYESQSKSSARTKALALPFFEDFSSTRTTWASTDRWTYGRSIRVNDGMAIRPPSVKVATFDGIDSTGRPYSTTVLAKGYADKLESRGIDLSTVASGERNSVYLSYAYQLKGRGERPDAGDRLLVSFLDKDLKWAAVDTVEVTDNMLTDVFYTSMIQVKEEKYFHPEFRFRIQNFARLSGPYDTWHVDYIYLNKGRTPSDLSFPDRTISEQLTSLFVNYRAVPIKHFRLNPATFLTNPSVVATNLRANNPQPVDYSTRAAIGYLQNGTVTKLPSVLLDNAEKVNQPLTRGVFLSVPSKTLPDLTALSTTADSIGLVFTFSLSTRDNKIVDPEGDGRGDTDPDEGDYDPLIYSPIDFRYSDTTRATFEIFNKYAYDDGVAEYGAGLNQAGAQLAYQYDMLEATTETVTHLEMYFPRFGDESSQVFELRIWNNLAEEPIYREVVSLQRGEENRFWLKELTEKVTVNKTFYIGWKQNSTAIIAAGLDKNTDSGSKVFSNTNGSWVKNDVVVGSLMFRPVFGVPNTGPVGLEDEKTLVVYPNPANGTFVFGGAGQVAVYDMTGRAVPFTTESTLTETKLTLDNATQGIYIVRVRQDGTVRSAKVMVR